MSNKAKQMTKQEKKQHVALRKSRKGNSRGKVWSSSL